MPKLYIETVGCQMNMLDSELVVAALRKDGYELTDSTRDADTILFNTCSVRQHAEDKIYSALGRLKNAKRSHPDKVIGVLGCMAQKDQRLIFERAPYVDIVVGPGQLHQVPQLVREARDGHHRRDGRSQRMEVSLGRKDGSASDIRRSHESFDPLRDVQMRPTPYQAYVRIMIGCDKFCTYCIVPSVRGPEQSRPPHAILAESRQLAAEGCREITLLGQTVNSYRYREGNRIWRLADLIESLHEIDGIDRIKFVTSYPRDMTGDLLSAVRDLPKACKYLHVPAQSGSDDVLGRMKRGYSVGQYREMLARCYEEIPGVAVTSDFIVGFCGETEKDFEATCDLVRESRFKNSFIFKYSERPGTKGAELFADDVPEDVKKRRNNELLAIQNAISEEENEPFIGRDVDVLVEGLSKAAQKESRDKRQETRAGEGELESGLSTLNPRLSTDTDGPLAQLTGRTMCDRIVVFEGNRRQIGQIVPVTIYDANAVTLFGHVVTSHVGAEVNVLVATKG